MNRITQLDIDRSSTLEQSDLGRSYDWINGTYHMTSESPYHVTTCISGGSDYFMFTKVINQGIDSHLEGFTESVFKHIKNRLHIMLHPDEVALMCRRLRELEHADCYQLATDIETMTADYSDEEDPEELWIENMQTGEWSPVESEDLEERHWKNVATHNERFAPSNDPEYDDPDY